MNDLYLEQRDFLNQSAKCAFSMDIQSLCQNIKNYILIIGEKHAKRLYVTDFH